MKKILNTTSFENCSARDAVSSRTRTGAVASALIVLVYGLFYTGLATAQTFTAITGASNPMEGVDVGTRSKPTLVDIDDDGDQDLFIGEDDGLINYFENTGTPSSPVFTERTGSNNPFNGVDIGNRSTLGFVDIDDDGDLDAFVGEKDGSYNFFQNTGSASSPIFSAVTGASNPLNGFSASGSGVNNNGDPKFSDLDNDGDWDMVSGEGSGRLRYYENTGNASSAIFAERTGAQNPLNGFDVGSDSSPGFVDADSDGDWDLFVGGQDGKVSFFENTGNSSSPSFTERTGVDNPMDGFDVGSVSNVTFSDLTGDGDTDAFLGETTGLMNFFTGSGTGNVPLPITLAHFDAVQVEDHVALDWTTASETNNDFFTIERSINGGPVEVVGRVEGAGNSAEQLAYSFADPVVESGRVMYRLKQTDFDGQFTYFDWVAVGLESQLESGDLIVYPNPVQQGQYPLLQMTCDWKQELSVSLIKMDGVTVSQKTVSCSTLTSTERISDHHLELESGMYVIQVLSGSETWSTPLIVR